MRILVTIWVWCLAMPLFAQVNIKGKVQNQQGEVLPGATITVSPLADSTQIISFAVSRSDGSFNLQFEVKDSVQLKVSYIGYASFKSILANQNQWLSITLKPSTVELKEVKVRYQPIRKKGDTLKYAVSAFQNQSDIVIGDVLNKLPGIEVAEDGTIRYQGKPIEKYYIDDLDLLEGRYNLANDNLPANAVDQVEILENHQPIKALDSLVFSENASINISLKKDVTVTGSAELSAGGKPFLWHANITPMLFARNKQLITSYQSNNVGEDVSRQLSQLGFIPSASLNLSNPENFQWLDILPLANPPFTQKVWLDNQVHMLSANYLQRLKKNTDIKVNASYLHDQQNQIGERTTTFTNNQNGETILQERTNNLLLNSRLNTAVAIERNTEKTYFYNNFSVDKYWDEKSGNVLSSSASFTQQSLQQPVLSLKDELKWVIPIRKNAFTINATLGHYSTPQELVIRPGVFETVLNEGETYRQLQQEVLHESWFGKTSVNWSQVFKRLTLRPQVGILYEYHGLQSSMWLQEVDSSVRKEEAFQNGLKYQKLIGYAAAQLQYRLKGKWRLNAMLPVFARSFQRQDTILGPEEDLQKVSFEPRLSLSKEFSHFWKFNLSGFARNQFGRVDELYYGIIIPNYRNIVRYYSPIMQQFICGGQMGIHYRNVLQASFFSASYQYEQLDNNVLRDNTIDENGAQIIRITQEPNSQQRHTLTGTASRFFTPLQTTVKVGASYRHITQPQLINEQAVESVMEQTTTSLSISSDLFSWLTLSAKANAAWYKTVLEETLFNSIASQSYRGSLHVYPDYRQTITIEGELFQNNFIPPDAENYFLNASYRYNWEKKKLSFSLQVRNILNTRQFLSVQNDTYYFIESSYQLRPRQFLVGVTFSF